MTNSPNPSRFVEAQLARLGITRKSYDAIVTSGDVTVSLLVAHAGAGLFHLGPANETALFYVTGLGADVAARAYATIGMIDWPGGTASILAGRQRCQPGV